MKKKSFMLALIIASGVVACSKDSDTDTNNSGGTGGTTLNCSSVPKTFAADVKAIIQNNCTGSSCHGTGSSVGPGALTTYAQIAANKVGVRSSVASGSMPKGSTLTTAQKNTILCWVDDGAKDN